MKSRVIKHLGYDRSPGSPSEPLGAVANWGHRGPIQHKIRMQNLAHASYMASGLFSKQGLHRGHKASNPTVPLTAGFSLAKVVRAFCALWTCPPSPWVCPMQQLPQPRASTEGRGRKGGESGTVRNPSSHTSCCR